MESDEQLQPVSKVDPNTFIVFTIHILQPIPIV